MVRVSAAATCSWLLPGAEAQSLEALAQVGSAPAPPTARPVGDGRARPDRWPVVGETLPLALALVYYAIGDPVGVHAALATSGQYRCTWPASGDPPRNGLTNPPR